MTKKLKIITKKINKKKFEEWLNTAIWFSVWLVSDKKHVEDARDFIFEDIGEKYQNSRDKAADKRMLMTILLNLWVGFCTGSPVMIYRNKNKYGKNGVYGKTFIGYDRTMRLLKHLCIRGYLQEKRGYYDRKDGRKKVTRIWGTEKLLRLFIEEYDISLFEDVYPDKDIKLVQLNQKEKIKVLDKKKNKYVKKTLTEPVDFDPKLTFDIEKNIRRYNDFAESQIVRIKMFAEDKVKPKILAETFLAGICTGAIKFTDAALDYKDPVENQCYGDNFTGPSLPVFSHETGLMISQYTYKKHSYSDISIMNEHTLEHIDIDTALICITNTLNSLQWQGIEQNNGKKHALFLYLFWLKKMFNLIQVKGRTKKQRRDKKRQLMKKARPLKDFGIKYLEFEINKKSLHRVFDCHPEDIKTGTHLNWNKGGRFFGPFYHQLHKEVRDCICINGNETVEIDFSGMHIRMLYHEKGLEYTQDPYGINQEKMRTEEEKKSERTKYKFVSLISINANRQEASGAIFKKLKDEGIKYKKGKGSIKKMMDAFMDFHNPIREHLFQAEGLGLQNKDSQIMEGILMRLLDLGICGHPVHDSVIIEKKHFLLVWDIMIEEYKKVMGYAPVLK